MVKKLGRDAQINRKTPTLLGTSSLTSFGSLKLTQLRVDDPAKTRLACPKFQGKKLLKLPGFHPFFSFCPNIKTNSDFLTPKRVLESQQKLHPSTLDIYQKGEQLTSQWKPGYHLSKVKKTQKLILTIGFNKRSFISMGIGMTKEHHTQCLIWLQSFNKRKRLLLKMWSAVQSRDNRVKQQCLRYDK